MTEFSIPDMSCGHCEKVLREALAEALPGAPVEIDLATHRLTVDGDPERASAAITEAGYTPVRLGTQA